MESARQLARQTLENRGIADRDYYMSLIEDAIARTAQTVPETDTNPASYFGPSLIESALTRGAEDRRMRYARDVDQLFGASAYDIVPDTYANDIIDRVLRTQRDEAVGALERARARGNLTDAGFSASMQRVGELETGGRELARSLASNALQGLRDEYDRIRSRAREAALSYTPTSTFSLEPFARQRQSFLDTLNTRLPGAVQNALLGQSFFDIGDILTRGGRMQGAQNPRIAALPFLMQEREDEERRGIGSTL
jgi:hypothetical protein